MTTLHVVWAFNAAGYAFAIFSNCEDLLSFATSISVFFFGVPGSNSKHKKFNLCCINFQPAFDIFPDVINPFFTVLSDQLWLFAFNMVVLESCSSLQIFCWIIYIVLHSVHAGNSLPIQVNGLMLNYIVYSRRIVPLIYCCLPSVCE